MLGGPEGLAMPLGYLRSADREVVQVPLERWQCARVPAPRRVWRGRN
jgi:hypothetical protein